MIKSVLATLIFGIIIIFFQFLANKLVYKIHEKTILYFTGLRIASLDKRKRLQDDFLRDNNADTKRALYF